MTGVRFPVVSEARDIARVVRLADTIWREHYLPLIGPAQVDYMLERFQSESAIAAQIREEGYRYHLVERDDGAIGYLAFSRRREGLFLSKMYLDAAVRGLGLGYAALEFVRAEAGSMGLDHLWLTVNRGNRVAIDAYRRWGFRVTEEVVQAIGGGFVMDDYRMQLDLVGPPVRGQAA